MLDATMLRDINETPNPVFSPNNLVEVGDIVFFTHNDGVHGVELWKSDGTEEGTVLVRDIWPGTRGSGPSNLTNVDGILYFSADDGICGNELWKSDGTEDGTRLVKDIFIGSSNSSPSSLINIDGVLYFAAITRNGAVQGDLWKSDGTEAGTVLVKEIYPNLPVNVNGVLYFNAHNDTNGNELWKSDGTEYGTVMVKDIRLGVYSSYPRNLTNVDGILYFSASDGINGVELWRSDGTEGGTVLASNIRPGTLGSSPSNLTNVGGILYFSADNGDSGVELWKSDGTGGGTILVKNIWPGGGSGNPRYLTNVDGVLYFSANNGTSGFELWKSDGTQNGTVQVKDIRLGPAGSSPSSLANVGGMLYFNAYNGTDGEELWKSDGTEGGTVLVKNIWPGNGSNPRDLTAIGGLLYFSASNGTSGRELWKSDGTEEGTVLVKNIWPGTVGSYPRNLTNVNGVLYFSSRDLWKSDGTQEGTVLVKNISVQESIGSANMTNVNGVLYFSAYNAANGYELWKSDGTEVGTILVKDIWPGAGSSRPSNLTNVDGILYFIAGNNINGPELWRSDGTEEGTVLVKDIRPGASGGYPRYLVNVDGVLYFNASDGVSGYELWKSDGTESGTILVKDAFPGANGSFPRELTGVDGVVYFIASNGTSGSELWKSDGTREGTALVKDIRFGPSDGSLANLTNVDGVLYFRAHNGLNGSELWKSDGTEAGTVLVRDIWPGTSGSYPMSLTNVGGVLYFIAGDANAHSLWRSDGTAAGTILIKDVAGIWGSGALGNLTNVDGVFYFLGGSRSELWRSDGMEAGTILAHTQPGWGNLAYLTDVDGTLFFAANDGINGTELWAVPRLERAADLAVTSMAAPGTSIFGEPISISWTVKNTGNLSADGPWFDQLWLSTDDTLSSDDVPLFLPPMLRPEEGLPLEIGGSYTQTVSIQLPLLPDVFDGDYYIIAHVNNSWVLPEIKTENNTHAFLITLVAPPLPDLVVSNIAAPLDAISGQAISISWTVTNQGTTPAIGPWTDSVWLSTDNQVGNDLHVGDFTYTGTLDPGESYTRMHSYNVPIAMEGERWLVIQTDQLDQVFEKVNVMNNTSVADHPIDVALAPMPDLVVSETAAPREAFIGQTIPISWTITNQGFGPATGTWTDQVWLSTDDQIGSFDHYIGGFVFTGTLNPGESITRIQHYTVPTFPPIAVGDYQLIVFADGFNEIYEHTNEANNTRVHTQSINVRHYPYPNLQVASVTAPTELFSGQMTVVEWVVSNVGVGSTSTPIWFDSVYLNTEPSLEGAIRLGQKTNASYLSPGDSYINSLAVTMPQGVSGIYYFIVLADSEFQVFEFEDDYDNSLPSGPATVQVTPPPDLQVSAVQAPANGFSGQELVLNWTVMNHGTGETRQDNWNDRVYLSLDQTFDESDIALATARRFGALSPGESYIGSTEVRLPVGISGTYYFIVRTDDLNEVYEHAFEGNNLAITSFATEIYLTPPPDLEIERIAMPLKVRAGESVSVEYRIVNNGSTETPNNFWVDQLWISSVPEFDPSSAMLVGSRSRYGAIQSGESYDALITAELPRDLDGRFFVFIHTDSANFVFELNKENNIGVSDDTILIESLPSDLVVSSFAAPEAVEAGQIFLVDWAVVNQGSGNTIASRWRDRIILSTDLEIGNSDDIVIGNYTHFGIVEACGIYSVQNQLVSMPYSVEPGNYYLFLIADVDDNVYERNGEANNASSPVEIVVSRPTSDLQVTDVAASSAVMSGQLLDVTWAVRNFGSRPTNSAWWYDDVYLSFDTQLDSGDIYLGRVQRTNQLNSLEQYIQTFQFHTPRDISGDYFVIVKADATNRVDEGSGEDNNVSFASTLTAISLSPVPDLEVVELNVPPIAASGQALNLSWTVRNVGQASTGGRAWRDAVYLSRDQVFDPDIDISLGYLESQRILGIGEQYTQSGEFHVPWSITGPFYVFVVADSGNIIHERGSEFNNIRYEPISMEVIRLRLPADLVAGTIVIPENASPGQFISLTYTVHNQGEATAFGSWTDSIYISSDAYWDLGDSLMGEVSIKNMFLSSGGSYTQEVGTRIPGVVPGEYHVIVRTDIRNQIAEEDEGNNITASLERSQIDLPELALGVSHDGDFANGRSVYYKVEVPEGETLAISLESAATNGSNSLYVAYERMPTQTSYDFASFAPFEANQRAVKSNTRAGTYYILVAGNGSLDGSSEFAIAADLPTFTVFDVNFGRGGTAGNRTIEINGAEFDRSVEVKLDNGSGVLLSAVDYVRTNDLKLYATFDLTHARPGIYDVLIEKKTTNQKIIVVSSFEVVNSSLSRLVATVSSPPAVSRPVYGFEFVDRLPFSFYVSWGNDSLNDQPAPLLRVQSNDEFGASMRELRLGAGTGDLIFYGSVRGNGPAGVVRPGDGELKTLVVRNSPIPLLAQGADFRFSLTQLFSVESSPVDWSFVRSLFRAEIVQAYDFPVILDEIARRTGSTNGDFLKMLSRNANLIGVVNDRLPSVSELLELEYKFARADMTASIRGRVYAPEFAVPISGIEIFAFSTTTGNLYTTTTHSDGSFVFSDLSDGTYVLESKAVSIPRQVFPIDSESRVSNVQVLASLREDLKVSVTDSSGLPVTGAVVKILSDTHFGKEATDDAGLSIFEELDPGDYELVVTAPGYASMNGQSVGLPKGGLVANVTLEPESVLTGQISVLGGGVLPDDIVVGAIFSAGAASDQVAIGQLYSDRYKIGELSSGVYDVSISSPGYLPVLLSGVDLSANSTVDLAPITLVPASRIVGSVIGNPNGISSVVLRAMDKDVVFSPITPEGTFSLDLLREGNYEVWIEWSSGREKVYELTIGIGEEIFDLDLIPSRMGIVRGVIQDSNSGIAISGIPVSLVPDNGDRLVAITNASGAFELLGLEYGSYKIVVPSRDGIHETSVSISEGAPVAQIDLTVDVRSRLSGTLSTAGGVPLESGRVELLLNDNIAAVSDIDSMGRYQFFIHVPGIYEVRAYASDGTFSTPYTITIGQWDEFELDFISGDGSVSLAIDSNLGFGRIEVVLYQEVAGTLVEASRFIHGDSDTVELLNLADGSYEVLAYSLRGNAVDLRQFTISQGGRFSGELTLRAPGGIAGSVRNVDNLPVANALVYARSLRNPNLIELGVTDSLGVFELAVNPNEVYDLVVIADGYSPRVIESLNLLESLYAEVELEAEAGQIEGFLLHSDGSVMAGALLHIEDGAGRVLAAAITGVDGQFVFKGVSGESLRIVVVNSGFSPSGHAVILANVSKGDILSVGSVVAPANAIGLFNLARTLETDPPEGVAAFNEMQFAPPANDEPELMAFGIASWFPSLGMAPVWLSKEIEFDRSAEPKQSDLNEVPSAECDTGDLRQLYNDAVRAIKDVNLEASKIDILKDQLNEIRNLIRISYDIEFIGGVASLSAFGLSIGALHSALAGASTFANVSASVKWPFIISSLVAEGHNVYSALSAAGATTDAQGYLGTIGEVTSGMNRVYQFLGQMHTVLSELKLTSTSFLTSVRIVAAIAVLEAADASASGITMRNSNATTIQFARLVVQFEESKTKYFKLIEKANEAIERYNTRLEEGFREDIILVDDRYQMAKGSVLTRGLPGVLANDEGVFCRPVSVYLDNDDSYNSLEGEFELFEDGSFYYSPPADFVGAVQFRYYVYDADRGDIVLDPFNENRTPMFGFVEIVVSEGGRDDDRRSPRNDGDDDENYCEGDSCDRTRHVGSYDPNDIIGPNGFGASNWVSGTQLLNYMIRFENDAVLATSPAQVVKITQQLDSDLDFRTFRVGDFAIGDIFIDVPENRAFYLDRIDLTESHGVFVDVAAGIDVVTGEVFWEFRSIDPGTGALPTDVLKGFLPPNIQSPQGEGFVTYTVRPLVSAVTGTVIDAEARIVFDMNQPIETPPIFNTVDAGVPVSQVEVLPSLSDEPIFQVRWSGLDDEHGSGLAYYTIYVSTDDSLFAPWLVDTTFTEAPFVGEPGRRYAFYSVARDNAGNVEAAPTVADAWTVVFAESATIGDRVWFDQNASGVQDADEEGAAGIVVRLYLADSTVPLAETVSAADGAYTFGDLSIRESYFLEFVVPNGYAFSSAKMAGDDSTDSDVDVLSGRTPVFTVLGGVNSQWDAGLVQLSSISGTVWQDSNGNGLFDAGEQYFAGHTVYLDLNDNGVWDSEEPTAVIGSNGSYSFTNLRPGDYIVRYALPEDWEVTTPSGLIEVGVDGEERELLPGTLAGYSFDLLPGRDLVDFDFGVKPIHVVPPKIEAAIIGDGRPQRSMIFSLEVSFDTIVVIDDGAFVLESGNQIVPIEVDVQIVDNRTVVVVNFLPSGFLNPSGSLRDGNYRLTTRHTHVRDLSGTPLAGDDSGQPGQSSVDEFFRKFGDATGDGIVDLVDYTQFRRVLGSSSQEANYNAAFDYDADGDVDLVDLTYFRRNLV